MIITPTGAARLGVLLSALAPDVAVPARAAGRLAAVVDLLVAGESDRIWLALAVLRAELPTVEAVTETRRALVNEPGDVVVKRILSTAATRGALHRPVTVHVVTDATVVDAHHTSRTKLATGIQRVVRKTLQVWAAAHPVVLVGWTSDFGALRELNPAERENTLHGTQPHSRPERHHSITIPWKSIYVLPELAIENGRTGRISALAEYSGNRTVVIGYDCVPFTTAETTAPGMASAFARNLTALSRFGRIAAISRAAALEYSSWRRMLSSIGLEGPQVHEILLAAEPEGVEESALAAAREVLVVDDLPLLLCVGSHEPRKNHLAVLHAAQVMWRAGRKFSLTFVGGNSWGSEEFQRMFEKVQSDGWPVQTISAISDNLLWSGYRLATATVFPSFNEGFGLPVAESLSVGTPVVTSRFGSMAEIAEGGGAVLVDPRDDADVLRGLELAMFDTDEQERLRAAALARAPRTWAAYADELWAYVHGTRL